jgi:hypothetical protein
LARPPHRRVNKSSREDFGYTLNDVLQFLLSFPILAPMAILVLCPQCGHPTEKLAALSQIARVDALYRCPLCSTVCTEPSASVIGKVVKLDDRQDAQINPRS